MEPAFLVSLLPLGLFSVTLNLWPTLILYSGGQGQPLQALCFRSSLRILKLAWVLSQPPGSYLSLRSAGILDLCPLCLSLASLCQLLCPRHILLSLLLAFLSLR